MSASRRLPDRERAVLGAILAVSVLIKLGLIGYLGARVYNDVMRSLNFGLGIEEGLVSITTHVDNTKSFLGPVLVAEVYDAGGLVGMKLFNVLAFVGLFVTTVRIGCGRHDPRVVVVALFLLAFYAGGHRNVVASELEDNLASVLFAGGLLVFLQTRRTFAPGVLMGVGFLVKFWVAIFFGAFGLYLLGRRGWRAALDAAAGGLLPLAILSLIDQGATVMSLLLTVHRQQGFSGWSVVATKMVTTGLLPTVVVSTWTIVRRPSEHGTLFFGIIASYLAYVLLFRDAFAATFVMMACLVPGGFLLAEWLVHSRLVGGAPRRGAVRLGAVLALYAVGNLGIAWQNLYRDTRPFAVHAGQGARPLKSGLPPS